MKVILTEDVKSIGSMGDIVDVKDGYARNFLFPKKLAQVAVGPSLKIIEAIKKKKVIAALKEKKEADALKAKISGLSLTITVEAGDDDKLFGSVTSQDVANSFEQEGVLIDKKKILLEDHIKKLGVYQIPVKLH
ncbi:MAG: 50S ribosomal protein L9, partial [Candidatus Omnitrophica bacterium CG22_combo_CG10-13_8_21_14_all_43_16]